MISDAEPNIFLKYPSPCCLRVTVIGMRIWIPTHTVFGGFHMVIWNNSYDTVSGMINDIYGMLGPSDLWQFSRMNRTVWTLWFSGTIFSIFNEIGLCTLCHYVDHVDELLFPRSYRLLNWQCREQLLGVRLRQTPWGRVLYHPFSPGFPKDAFQIFLKRMWLWLSRGWKSS